MLNCENCGAKDDLERFEHVLCGITLCQDCADLPLNRVKKRKIEWIKLEGEYFPPDFRVVDEKRGS